MFNSKNILTLCLLVLSTACSGRVSSKSTEITPSESTSPIEEFFQNQPPMVDPARIAIAIDFTGSRDTSRIGEISLKNFIPLIDTISSQGGEIGIIAICSDSNKPALRVRVESPPYLNPKQFDHIIKPISPDIKGISPFKAAELKQKYQQQLIQYKKLKTEAIQNISVHQQNLQQWQDLKKQNVDNFKSELKTLLKLPATCQSSDIWGAIARIDLFLNEDTSTWNLTPNNFAVLITDGEHNSDREPVAMQSEAEILLVNGAAKEGELQQYLDYKPFEAPSAAFKHLAKTINKAEVKNEK